MKTITMIISMAAFVTFSNAQTWTIIPVGTATVLSSVSFGTTSTVYVAGIGKTLLKSTNGGVTFSPVASFATGNEDFWACYFNNSDTGYVAGGNFSGLSSSSGFIYRTVNGGASFTKVTSGLPGAFNDITFPDPQYGYAVGGESGSGIIYKSSDYGQTWTGIYNSNTIANGLASVFFLNNTDGYVSGADESAFQSKLINVTGGLVTGNVNYSAYPFSFFTDVYFKSIDTGFVTVNGGTNYILKTTDHGVTWNPVYSGAALNSITFSSDLVGWAVGLGGIILQSLDGGTTWTSVTSPVTEELRSVAFVNPNLGIIAGSNGRILRWDATAGISEFPSLSQPLIIYQNPDNGTFQIKNLAGENTVDIYNGVGQLALHLNKIMSNMAVDISTLSPGIYSIVARSNKKAFTAKILKKE